MPSPLSASDTRHGPPLRLYYRLRPALRTAASVALLLGALLTALVLLVAWIRTPETLYVTTDPRIPRMVRGGESLRAILPWALAELWPGVGMVLAGLAVLLATGERRSGASISGRQSRSHPGAGG